jgi:hypothetical protein
LEEIAVADRKVRNRRLLVAVGLTVAMAAAAYLAHELDTTRRFEGFLSVAGFIGGMVFLIINRQRPESVICKDCERVHPPSRRRLCPCGGRLFPVRELKWVEQKASVRTENATDLE